MKTIQQKKLIEQATLTDSNLLITGPTGSGKSTLAKAIHEKSRRSSEPFITLNLATLNEGTLESELFGHERGSFTGATQNRIGRIQLAKSGTIFLDEISELSLRLQARLLEFLQSKKIVPVGSNREIELDVRIIAASNRDLTGAVKKNEFREDLFHRLRVLHLDLPALSDLSEGFGEKVHECLEKVTKKANREIKKISGEVAEILEKYSWPGNYRELQNVLEFAVWSSQNGEIEKENLPEYLIKNFLVQDKVTNLSSKNVAEIPLSQPYHEALVQFERTYLEYQFKRNHYRVNATAREIGLNKSTFIRRLYAYRIGVPVN